MKPSLLFIHRSVGHNLIVDSGAYQPVRDTGQPSANRIVAPKVVDYFCRIATT